MYNFIVGSLNGATHSFTKQKVANVLGQYYERRGEASNSVFNGLSQTTSLKEHYVVPRLKMSHQNEYSREEKYDSAITVAFPEDLLIPGEWRETQRYFTLIEGVEGIGKSTLCQYLAMKWAEKIVLNKDATYAPDKEFSLLVWLPLKDVESYMKLAKKDFSIASYLYHRCDLKENFKKEGLEVADINRVLEQTQAETLYVLDSCDEIADAINCSAVHYEFKKFLQKLFLDFNVVMTSRPFFSRMISRVIFPPFSRMVSRLILQKKRNLELVGFGPADIQEYIEKYFSKKYNDRHAEEKINGLLEYIKHHSDLTNLLSTPIFIQLLCSFWEEKYLKQNLEIEITKCDLYSHFVEFSLNKISLNKGTSALDIGKDTQERRKYFTQRVLGQLAFYRLKNINFQITAQNIAFICKGMSEDAGDILLENVLKSGFLNPIDETYEFIHLGLQEFYAAFHVTEEFLQARQNNSSFKLDDLLGDKKNKYNEKYHEMWRFTFSLLAQKQTEFATEFFELINAGTVSYSSEWVSLSLKNVPNQFIVKPDGIGSVLFGVGAALQYGVRDVVFSNLKDSDRRRDMGDFSINRRIHLQGRKDMLKAATLFLASLEQIMQIEGAPQQKSLSVDKKEQYLAIARSCILDIVYNYPLILDADFVTTELRMKFMKTITLSPRLLKENLLAQIPQTVTISDSLFRAKILTFYCELHQLGDYFSDDISNKINKEIFDNFESIDKISWRNWFISWRTSVSPFDNHLVQFDTKKLLSHEIIAKLISYYILDDQTLEKIFDAAYKLLPALAQASRTSRLPLPPSEEPLTIPQSRLKLWLFTILSDQYVIAPEHLLGLIEDYSIQHNDAQPEKLEKLKADLDERNKNVSASLPIRRAQISQHSFWCCKLSPQVNRPARVTATPSCRSQENFDAPEPNLLAYSKVAFFKESPYKRESIQPHLHSQKSTVEGIFIPTKDDGNCAFHAILGEEYKGIIQCRDIATKRETLKKAIMNPDNIDYSVRVEFIKVMIDGIQNWIMSSGGSPNPHSGSYKLAKDYSEFEKKMTAEFPKIWGSFEQEINRHDAIIKYIAENNTLNESASFKDKFYNVLLDQKGEKEDELYHLIFSLPSLQKSFDEYNYKMGAEYNWAEKIFVYPNVREEFAAFVGTPRVWLAAPELLLIAYAFEKTVHYSPYPGAEWMEFNPGKSIPVRVQFNGRNHFERMEQDSVASRPSIAFSLCPSQ